MKEAKINNNMKPITKKVKENKSPMKKACWAGYQMVGMKEKNGRQVPNCVPNKKQ